MMLILRLPGYKNKQKSASKRPCIITDPIKKIMSDVRYQENKC
jgi:hypothetical protein